MTGTKGPPENKFQGKTTPVDWNRFGLNSDSQGGEQAPNEGFSHNDAVLQGGPPHHNELFLDQCSSSQPWWKANFFLSQPVLFGTWDGVFTTCMIHLFGVIVFLRAGWIVGNAGIGLGVLIVLTTVGICTIAVISGIGICQRCHIESGGVHFLLSHVLGAQIGGAVSLIYCFGQAVSCALHVMGFAESLSHLIVITNPWIERALGFSLIILLLGINIAGVKWVIRLQFALLVILLFAALDFAVGTFVHTDLEHGVTGYRLENFKNNSGPQFMEGQNWFTMFGVFFPAMTGVFAGINMSGDLYNPTRDIPVGTLTSVGTSLFLYLLFIVGLGATVERWALLSDYMIAEKVSAIGVLLLAALYISSMSACLGALYGTPRIIQSIANENVIPVLKFLGHGKGPNKVPVYALIVFALVTFIFIVVGQINTLAPIVTIPFLLTYASVEYAYFSLAMTFDMQQKREQRYYSPNLASPASEANGDVQKVPVETAKVTSYGATLSNIKQQAHLLHQSSQVTESPLTSPDEHSSMCSMESKNSKHLSEPNASDRSSLIDKGGSLLEIDSKSRSWYSILANRWLAIFGALVKLVIMFLVQWGYALSAILVMWVIWFYIGQVNPGVFPGIAEFRLFPWLKNGFLRCIGCYPREYDQIVVTPVHPGVEVLASQLTEENTDYASRERYHQSTTVKPEAHLIDQYEEE